MLNKYCYHYTNHILKHSNSTMIKIPNIILIKWSVNLYVYVYVSVIIL